MKVRLRTAIEPFASVDFASSESELVARLIRPVRLVILDGAPPLADPRLPARIRAALRELRVPIVVIAASRETAWSSRRALIAAGQMDDVIHSDTERMDALVAAWSLCGDRCRRKVEALRLAHQCAPAPLHRFLEEMLLAESADLSVTSWAASKPESSRFALRRQLAREGVKPTVLVNVARLLNAVARVLLRTGGRSALTGHQAQFPEVRAARRLLWRTMGMTLSGVTELAEKDGPDAVRARARQAVGEMLGARGNRPVAS